MQSSKIQAGADDLAIKLVSLNNLENHAAVNQYFDTHAVWTSDYLCLSGASHIKAQFDLFNWLFEQSELRLSSYDSSSQTITIRTERTPYLVHLPFASLFVPVGGKYQYEATVHLNPDGESKKDEGELLVTKVEVERVSPTAVEKLIPWWVIRPVLGLLVSALAFITALRSAPPSSVRGLVGFGINIAVHTLVYFFQFAKHLTAGILHSTAGTHHLGVLQDGPKIHDGLANAVEKIQNDLLKQASQVPQAKAGSSGSNHPSAAAASSSSSHSESRGRRRSANGGEGRKVQLGTTNPAAPDAPSFAQVAADTPPPPDNGHRP